MIGRLISGRYRIEEKVGTGGMAVVYRARDEQTDRLVAIKVLRPEYETDIEFVLRFGREAEAAAKVSHENIVNLLDVGIDGEMRYIVMEYVDGSTLKEMIRDEGKIHPDVALRMTIRILAAVDHAHRNGIVHRDIKPQNILVDREGRVKVADFGIARLKSAQTDAEGSALGSVHYLSPEQARGEVADEQSDLYSVGVVLYEMLTGSVPFDGNDTIEVAMKHVNEEAPSMREKDPHISRALDEVVKRALCKDKARRYQSAAEMAADLRKTIVHPRGGFVRYPEIKDSAAQPRKARPQKDRKRTIMKRLLIAAAVFVLVSVLTLLVLSFAYTRKGPLMPALRGVPEETAVQTLEEMGIHASVVNAYSEDCAPGCVMLQSVDAHRKVQRGEEVVLTVSLGSQWYEFPDMAGWTLDAAMDYLREAGAANIAVEYVQNGQPAGTVASADHEPGRLTRDEPIALRVSGQSVMVPQLTGLTLESAQAVLEAEGLRLGEVSEGTSADAKSGSVIAQSVAPYTQTLAESVIDLTLCGAQEVRYAPDSPLTLVVPLNGIHVSVTLTTPSGQSIEAFSQELDAGTHQAYLMSSEPGLHGARVFMDDVLFENIDLNFE